MFISETVFIFHLNSSEPTNQPANQPTPVYNLSHPIYLYIFQFSVSQKGMGLN